MRGSDPVGLHVVADPVEPVATCRVCRLIKGQSEFHRDKKSSTGFRSICKACSSVERKVRTEAKAGRVPAAPKPEIEAWDAAVDLLIERHPTEFRGLLYTEKALRGLVAVQLPKYGRQRDRRFNASLG